MEESWQGRPVLLLSWCAGRPLVEVILAQPRLMRPLAFDFGRMQARIHAIVAPAGLGFGLGTLLHGDYHPMNVLADETTVLDWVNVVSGDPRADLARTVLLLRLSDPSPGVPLPQFRALRRSFEGAWRRGYESAAGLMDDLTLFYAEAGAARLEELADKA